MAAHDNHDLTVLQAAREELAQFLAQAEEAGHQLRIEVFARLLGRVEAKIALARGGTTTMIIDEDGEVAAG